MGLEMGNGDGGVLDGDGDGDGQTGTCRLGECLTGPKKANGPTTATAAAAAQQQHQQQQMALKKPSQSGGSNKESGLGAENSLHPPTFCWFCECCL